MTSTVLCERRPGQRAPPSPRMSSCRVWTVSATISAILASVDNKDDYCVSIVNAVVNMSLNVRMPVVPV